MMTPFPKKILMISGGGNLPKYAINLLEGKGIGVEILLISDALFKADFKYYDNIAKKISKANNLYEAIKFVIENDYKDIIILGSVKRQKNAQKLLKKYENKATKSTNVDEFDGNTTIINKYLQLFKQSDGNAMNEAAELTSLLGINIWSINDILPEILAQKGCLTMSSPSNEDMKDIELGVKALKRLGELDIGQGCVVAENRVIAVEAAEGTNLMLKRCKDIRSRTRLLNKKSGVFVKFAKPNQDIRLDLPVIGLQSIRKVHKAKLNGIAIEAGKVIIADEKKLISYANSKGLYIWSM